FYAARSSSMPPLPWPNFSPPFSAPLSNLRLCYWLTHAHVDFGCAPAYWFGSDDTAIIAAFGRYIEPVYYG
ncbi:hypothetical protein ACFOD7_16080, partial [Paracoccus fontiphilus]